MPLRLFCPILLLAAALLPGACHAQALAPVPAEIASSHFVVTIDGASTPVMHAAVNLYFLNFPARADALVTVTADQEGFWNEGVEVQPWRLNIRPRRSGRTLTFRLEGAAKISLSRPGDYGAGAEMLYLFANPPEVGAPAPSSNPAPAGLRYFAPGVHHENIDAAAGDRIYLAAGAVVFGSLNLWQVDHVSVSGPGVIVYDGPQNPADDDGWMHRKNWHCIVMDQAHDISISGITCVVRSRTWQIQMKDSRGILFDNIKVIGANEGNANADGMDWLGGGDTVVRNSFFRAADDIFALQTSWDGYGTEAFSHQGRPVTNISIEGGVFSTSISNIVRAGWPEKNFEGGNFTMRDADILHMGFGGCGIPFALMELWADPNGRGRSAGFAFQNLRLEDWYSLLQLRQPADGVRQVSLQDVAGLETPALVASTLKGNIREVTLDRAGTEPGTPPLQVLEGAGQPAILDGAPQAQILQPGGLLRPRQRLRFEAVSDPRQRRHNRYHWTFGDGTEATGFRVSHRFPDTDGTLLDGTGRFRVLLEVTNEAGRHAWAYAPVIVSQALMPAASPASLSSGLTYVSRETAVAETDTPSAESDTPGADADQARAGTGTASTANETASAANETPSAANETASSVREPVTGITPGLSLASVAHDATAYSVSFAGYLDVPADGGYSFLIVANEGATLELDGRTIATSKPPIAQVCGLPGMAARAIQATAALGKGMHSIRMTEQHSTGKDDFRVLWRGPGFTLQSIRPENLKH